MSLSHDDEQKKPISIDLEPLLLEKRLIKYVTFDGIRKDSILRFHEKEMHERLKKRDEKHNHEFKLKHLLNVCVANTGYIYDLEETIEKGKEI